ncbi:MAG: hypothetical protein KIT48_19515 [Pseudolabrys sp.]|nr:hypothetical protein [Pseudolabrys sp.]
MPAKAKKTAAAKAAAASPSFRDRKKSVLLQLHNRKALCDDPKTSRLLLIAGEIWRRLMTSEAPTVGASASALVERVDTSISQDAIDRRMALILDADAKNRQQRKYAEHLRQAIGQYAAEVLDAVARDDLEIDLAAKRLYGKDDKLSVVCTRERLRASLHSLTALLRLPGT